jgi:hypothetical protein
MRKILFASLILATPALAQNPTPDDVAAALGRMRVLYIRGENVLMTVTGINFDAKARTIKGTAQYQSLDGKGVAYGCEAPIEGQLMGYRLQFASNRCTGDFTYKNGEFAGEVTVPTVGLFEAKFAVK